MKKLTVIVKPANREDVIDIMESCDGNGYHRIWKPEGLPGDVPWNHERTECTDEM